MILREAIPGGQGSRPARNATARRLRASRTSRPMRIRMAMEWSSRPSWKSGLSLTRLPGLEILASLDSSGSPSGKGDFLQSQCQCPTSSPVLTLRPLIHGLDNEHPDGCIQPAFMYKAGNCAYIHNPFYAAQILLDSLKALERPVKPWVGLQATGHATDYRTIVVNP